MIDPRAATSPVMTTYAAPALMKDYSKPSSQQSEPYLSIALKMKHCMMCNRQTPYFITYANTFLERLWLCWEHLGEHWSKQLKAFYEEEEEAIIAKLESEHRAGLR